MSRLRPSGLRVTIAQPLGVHLLWPSEVKKGIRIVDPFFETRACFVAAVGEALELIRRIDPMRFARVKREIRTIKYAGPPWRRGIQPPLQDVLH